MKTLSEALGNVIRTHRQASGLSQEQLAAQSGMHRTSISFIERGIKSPTVETLDKIGRTLDVSPWRMLREAETRMQQQG